MIVRREQVEDEALVRSIHVAAFARTDEGEPVEARLLDELRGCDGWIRMLSFVVVMDGAVVGHAVCTRGFVGETAGLALGPIAVAPLVQRSGAGSALMHTMIGAADALDEPFIALLGSPEYYSRFGFSRSSDAGIEPPDPTWGIHFQARRLAAFDATTRGTFRYASPFSGL